MPSLPQYVDPATPTTLTLGGAPSTSTIEDSGLEIERSILPGGIRLITQQIPGALSASLGMWVAVGSRDEGPGEGGISHFLEHLLFKGTTKRSAFEIAEAFDAVGAESNAATTKEATYYWAHMVADDLPELLPVLTDMVTDSVISDEDVEVERGVILDELAMSDDSPSEVAGELFARAVYGDSELGRPIGGTRDSVEGMAAQKIRDLYHRKYGTDDLIVSVAGDVDHGRVRDQLLEAMSNSPWAAQLAEPIEPKRRVPSTLMVASGGSHQRNLKIVRDIEQAHLLVGGPWLRALDPAGPASSVTFNLLGGGMSSRLFQEIREKRGLAYSTYAFPSAYSDAGYFALYAGCAPRHLAEVEKVMWGEVEKLAEFGPTDKELLRSRGQIRGGVTLNLEDPSSRMSRLARSELVGELVSVSDALARIDAVQKEDVQEIARQMLGAVRSSAIVSSND
ncbi:M16 family metallopeptidase [Actinomyces minihominis]|uniref:M16 family metallopeptidase n=1 Tax=Actinomyces minihominis TaxID=2002838 RepID=UPI001F5CED4F|nr:pitrilysin family protein [Actinomyces minihominis]